MKEPRLYTASKTHHAHIWRDLRDKGFNITSTWIDEAGPGESKDLGDLWERCIAETAACDLFLIYAEPGEILKGAIGELVLALFLQKPVFAVGIQNLTVSHHRGITHYDSLGRALFTISNFGFISAQSANISPR